MPHPVQGIDHVMFLVRDLDAAARRFETLGFTLSPRGTHSPHMGSANFTIVFPDDYLELLGIIAETPRNEGKRKSLAERGDSLTAVACRIGDARAARASLAELGIATSDVMDFSRPLPLPDGSSGVASFSVTTFGPGESPRGEMFMCQHKTRGMVWRPELLTHANGARALAGIVVASETPRETADAYARLFAGGRVCASEKGFRVATGEKSAAVLCMTPAAISEYYSGIDLEPVFRRDFAALQIAVADIDAARALLRSRAVAFQNGREKNLFISPVDAGGAVLELIET